MTDAATDAAVLAEVLRAERVESRHRGHAIVCDARGGVVAAWGNPDEPVFPRSSCKMLQALPLVESGAGADLGSEQLALACASHSGGSMHVTRVAGWLETLGLGESDLRCGPQIPDDAAERHRLEGTGESPCQLHNNCSGKHAGFLTLNRHLRGGPEYVELDHPVQAAARAAFEEMCGAPILACGVDGCSAPAFETTLRGLGAAMARMADPRGLGRAREAGARRLVAAMAEHPLLVAGEGRACSELMAAMPGGVAVKTGAEAVYVAILPEQGLGAALKVEDGGTRGSECAIAALLVRLGALDPGHPAARRRLAPSILSRRGAEVGAIRPATAFYEEGRRL